jgi:hypothetical protein
MTNSERYEKAIQAYFDTLDELDKIHGLMYKTQHRFKLKRKLKELSVTSRRIEVDLAKENEIYLKAKTA